MLHTERSCHSPDLSARCGIVISREPPTGTADAGESCAARRRAGKPDAMQRKCDLVMRKVEDRGLNGIGISLRNCENIIKQFLTEGQGVHYLEGPRIQNLQPARGRAVEG